MIVGFLGAGCIGLYVGCHIAAAGTKVVFCGRQWALDVITTNKGLKLTSFDGEGIDVPQDKFSFVTSFEEFCQAGVDVVIVTTKTSATASAAEDISRMPSSVLVVSLQNGTSNVPTLRAALPNHKVLAASCPFNVQFLQEKGVLHRGSSGPLAFDDQSPKELLQAVQATPLSLHTYSEADMQRLLHGKLVVNLNNSVNSLVGLSLYEQMTDWYCRQVLADMQQEALAVLAAEGIQPISFLLLPLWLVPYGLRLPTWIFTRVSKAALQVDRTARSSMWDDLERRRPTEIDILNGFIIDLAKKHNVPTPVTSCLYDLVKKAETSKTGCPNLLPQELYTKANQAKSAPA
eukprot:Colp12_sorted_trinity150504_noHs@1798